MDDFYIQRRGGWNVVMFHGGEIAPGRVLIYAHREANGKLQWSLRDPIRQSVIRSGTFGHIGVDEIEASAGEPIRIPEYAPGNVVKFVELPIDSQEWITLAREHTPDPNVDLLPTIGELNQWTAYEPQEELP